MDFTSYLQDQADNINQALEIYLDELEVEIKSFSPQLINVAKPFIKGSEGGKRLRGVLVALGYELVNGEKNDDIYKLSSAIEIFQTAILAHDDVIDLSETRRNKPTVFKALGGDHYAISQAICLGDLGLFLGTKMIADGNFPDDRKNKVLSLFSKMIIDTALGEMLDVELPHLKSDRQERDVLTIHKFKTAYYTIIYPLSLGAILAGGGDHLIEQLTEFGESLGIAFQIQDDILGVFGDEKTLGKSVTSDIEEGKNTLLITEALRNANQKQREVLDKYYGKGKIDEAGLNEVREVFKDTGALEYSQKKAEELVNKSKEVLENMEIDQKYKDLLSQMSEYIIQRQK